MLFLFSYFIYTIRTWKYYYSLAKFFYFFFFGGIYLIQKLITNVPLLLHLILCFAKFLFNIEYSNNKILTSLILMERRVKSLKKEVVRKKRRDSRRELFG